MIVSIDSGTCTVVNEPVRCVQGLKLLSVWLKKEEQLIAAVSRHGGTVR